MSKKLGVEMIVENRAGAGGAIGTLAVARAEPDGHTLLFAPALVVSVLPQAREDTGYKPDALVPVCQTFVNAMALVVAKDSPLKDVRDLIVAAKQKPGVLNYGHQGPLTIPHLAMEELLLTASADIKDVPYRGDPLVLSDLIGGRIEVGAVVLGSIGGQDVRVLGVFSDTRHSSYPQVPTMREQGFDVSSASFGGIFAPKGTPAPVVAKLADACAAGARDEVYATVAKGAAQPADFYADAATLGDRVTRDIAAKARVLKRVGAAGK
jgi:tripartite-type tricarboxylate transporter receptor subunit TctC